jgi:hypothetical protein
VLCCAVLCCAVRSTVCLRTTTSSGPLTSGAAQVSPSVPSQSYEPVSGCRASFRIASLQVLVVCWRSWRLRRGLCHAAAHQRRVELRRQVG